VAIRNVPWRLAVLAAGLACAASVAAAPRPRASLELHYTMVTHRFAVADYPGRDPDLRDPTRNIEWRYPVFRDPHDPATPALNAWIRHESLKLLDLDIGDADRLTDDQVIARAIASHEFADGGIDQATVMPDTALGRYRSITTYSEIVGGTHPVHGISTHLFSLDRRTEIPVSSLFKPDDDGVLQALFDAQPEAACPDASFDWAQASLTSIDTLSFEFPYRPGRGLKDVDCGVLGIHGPQVTRMLESPRSLRPAWRLVMDPS